MNLPNQKIKMRVITLTCKLLPLFAILTLVGCQREHPLLRKYNAGFEQLRNDLAASEEEMNRVLEWKDTNPSAKQAFRKGTEMALDFDLADILRDGTTTETQLVQTMTNIRLTLDAIKNPEGSTPNALQRAEYGDIHALLSSSKTKLLQTKSKSRSDYSSGDMQRDILTYELAKMAALSIDDYISVSMVQQAQFDQYLE